MLFIFLDEVEDVDVSKKVEIERTSLKRNLKKKNEQPSENFVFKKPETPSKSTSPVM